MCSNLLPHFSRCGSMYDRNGSFSHRKMSTVSTFQTTFSSNLSTLRCANLDESKWHRCVFNLYKRTHLGRWPHALSWLPTSHGKSLEKGRTFIFDEAALHPLSCSPCERQHIEFFFRLYTFVTTEEKAGKESNKRECEAAEWLDHGPPGCESLAPNT